MISKKFSSIGLFGVALFALPLMVNAGDAGKGGKLVTEKGCNACHGVDGNSTVPTFPILAGPYEDYLVQALEQYRSDDRKNPIMGPAAAGLTDREIADLAAWFSSQKSKLQYVK